MTTTIKATYVQGVFRPQEPVALPDGAQVELTLTMPTKEGDPLAGLIGIFSSGRTDGAANHDKYIYRDPRS
jgi:predicted DNA-binding antitoxin AbrB/MazE fold protein